jgi:hypothetical protein
MILPLKIRFFNILTKNSRKILMKLIKYCNKEENNSYKKQFKYQNKAYYDFSPYKLHINITDHFPSLR